MAAGQCRVGFLFSLVAPQVAKALFRNLDLDLGPQYHPTSRYPQIANSDNTHHRSKNKLNASSALSFFSDTIHGNCDLSSLQAVMGVLIYMDERLIFNPDKMSPSIPISNDGATSTPTSTTQSTPKVRRHPKHTSLLPSAPGFSVAADTSVTENGVKESPAIRQLLKRGYKTNA